jgi:hypothetical protein
VSDESGRVDLGAGRPAGGAAGIPSPVGQDPRAAVREHEIVCLLCGSVFRQLTNTHLQAHGLTSLAYKRRFGYNVGRPLMCHALRRFYAERARQKGLATRIERRPILENPDLRRQGGGREIALEETLARREVQQRPRRRWSARDGRGRFASSPSARQAEPQDDDRARPGA